MEQMGQPYNLKMAKINFLNNIMNDAYMIVKDSLDFFLLVNICNKENILKNMLDSTTGYLQELKTKPTMRLVIHPGRDSGGHPLLPKPKYMYHVHTQNEANYKRKILN